MDASVPMTSPPSRRDGGQHLDDLEGDAAVLERLPPPGRSEESERRGAYLRGAKRRQLGRRAADVMGSCLRLVSEERGECLHRRCAFLPVLCVLRVCCLVPRVHKGRPWHARARLRLGRKAKEI